MTVETPGAPGSQPDQPSEPFQQTLLTAEGLVKEFGGLTAVNDVSLDIVTGSIASIIGPNGAGKTTFFNMLTGLYKPTRGRILFAGRDVTRARPDRITALASPARFRTSACSRR